MAKNPKTTEQFSLTDGEAAFRTVQHLIIAVSETDAGQTAGTDIPTASIIALATSERVATYMPQIAQLPFLDVPLVKSLDAIAMAAWYCDVVAFAPEDVEFRTLMDEAIVVRRAMLVAADALVHAGLLPAAQVAEIHAGHGNLDSVNDTGALGKLFKDNWGKIEGKTAITLEQVRRASELAVMLLRLLGKRRYGDEAPAVHAHKLARAQAWTLLVRAYGQTKRAMTYLRWDQGDAEEIVPSLYARDRKRAGGAEEVEPTAPAEVVAEPVAAAEVVAANPAAPGGGTTSPS